MKFEQPKENIDIFSEIYRPQEWDEELFIEAYNVLNEDWQSASEKQRPRILANRYMDTLFLSENSNESVFEQNFVIRIPKVNIRQTAIDVNKGDVQVESNTGFKEYAGAGSVKSNAYQYGPSRIYDLESGDAIFVPKQKFSEQDIVGTEKLSRCTVLVVKTKKGIFVTHETGGILEIRKMIQEIKEKVDNKAQVHVVVPEKFDLDKKRDEKFNEQYDNLTSEFENVILYHYPYIDFDAWRPEGVEASAVLVFTDNLLIVNLAKYKDAKKQGITKARKKIIETKIISI